LALGAVAVTAGVIGGALIATGVTLLDVASQGGCAAALTACMTLRCETGNG